MKKITYSLIVAGLFLANIAFAHIEVVTVETALQDIYTSQHITLPTQIDCTKVSPVQFENLGDAYMGSGITKDQHAAMEQVMGG